MGSTPQVGCTQRNGSKHHPATVIHGSFASHLPNQGPAAIFHVAIELLRGGTIWGGEWDGISTILFQTRVIEGLARGCGGRNCSADPDIHKGWALVVPIGPIAVGIRLVVAVAVVGVSVMMGSRRLHAHGHAVVPWGGVPCPIDLCGWVGAPALPDLQDAVLVLVAVAGTTWK